MIIIVCLFSLHFFLANRLQSQGKRVIEGVVSNFFFGILLLDLFLSYNRISLQSKILYLQFTPFYFIFIFFFLSPQVRSPVCFFN